MKREVIEAKEGKDICIERERVKTYISIELANEAREVVVLEVSRKQIPSEIRNFPHHKRGAPFVPRYHVVVALIIHQLIRLHQKRRRYRPLPHYIYTSPLRFTTPNTNYLFIYLNSKKLGSIGKR